MTATPPRKVFTFAVMMVLAQRRHAARLEASDALLAAERSSARAEAARRTLQKMMGTKRLVAFMVPA